MTKEGIAQQLQGIRDLVEDWRDRLIDDDELYDDLTRMLEVIEEENEQ